MTSRERTIRAILFQRPDRIPIQIGELFAAYLVHGEAVDRLRERYPMDITPMRVDDAVMNRQQAKVRRVYVDGWGCRWENQAVGNIGVVTGHPLAEDSAFAGYRPPVDLADKGFDDIPNQMSRGGDTFLLAVGETLFHRIAYLRGFEQAMIDLIEDNSYAKRLREMTFDFLLRRVRAWLKYDIDGFSLSDDWGTQESLMISPVLWRKYFKPLYAEIAAEINARGCIPIIHSCGQVSELIEDFVEIGWKAGNFQTHLLGAENLAGRFTGRFAFYGTLEYQRFMANGTPEEIHREAEHLKRCLWTKDGGFVAYTVAGLDVPLENLKAFLEAWEPRRTPIEDETDVERTCHGQ